jgi:hypothetical protein
MYLVVCLIAYLFICKIYLSNHSFIHSFYFENFQARMRVIGGTLVFLD